MKRMLCLILAVMLLWGCSAPETPTEETEPQAAEAFGPAQNWDREGVLEQIPLTVPGLWQLGNAMACRDGVLLWTCDGHLEEEYSIELCLIDGQTGLISARNTIPTVSWVTPQVLGERLFLCDGEGGTVLELDENLEQLQSWSFEAEPGQWYMSGCKKLYYQENGAFKSSHIELKAQSALLEEGDRLNFVTLSGDQLAVDYMDGVTGENRVALLDLTTGELALPPFDGSFGSADRLGDHWLCSYATDSSVWVLGTGDDPKRVRLGDSGLRLLDEGYLLQTNFDGSDLRLYDLEGGFVSGCRLSETGTCYLVGDPMWCQGRGGYYLQVQSYDSGSRLLFWDIEKGTEGENLDLESVPERTQAMQQLRDKADGLEQTYGVSILLADECSREFDTFVADYAEDPVQLLAALDDLEQALASYPEGFIRKLRWGDMGSIQIQFIQNLRATDERSEGSYAAFTQDLWDHYLMVVDVNTGNVQTYFHEFSHIIDTCLLWEGVLREEEWAQLNPVGFAYAYSYTAEWELRGNPDYFVDTYAMVSPTEDRARVLEYAMIEGAEWTFEDHPGVRAKLELYARLIRQHFQIPDEQIPLWEQYL